jgi:hypothetical protein
MLRQGKRQEHPRLSRFASSRRSVRGAQSTASYCEARSRRMVGRGEALVRSLVATAARRVSAGCTYFRLRLR